MFYSDLCPRIYVDNKTDDTIENITFTFGGKATEDTNIKKLKKKPVSAKFTRKIVPLINLDMEGTKQLIMYYYDKNNIKHEHIIMEELNAAYKKCIGVEILKINDDGSLNFNCNLDIDILSW